MFGTMLFAALGGRPANVTYDATATDDTAGPPILGAPTGPVYDQGDVLDEFADDDGEKIPLFVHAVPAALARLHAVADDPAAMHAAGLIGGCAPASGHLIELVRVQEPTRGGVEIVSFTL